MSSIINWHGRNIELDTLGWFADKVCVCPTFKYRQQDLTWPNPPDWNKPPRCRNCEKLDRQLVMKCARCSQMFYRYFSHPRSGFYHNSHSHNPVGWFCYSCLENDMPGGITMVKSNVLRAKVAPTPELVPPDYRHAEKRTYDSDIADRLAKFRESLKGI